MIKDLLKKVAPSILSSLSIEGIKGVIKILKIAQNSIGIKHLVIKNENVIRDILEGNFPKYYRELRIGRLYIVENEILSIAEEILKERESTVIR